MAKSEKFVYARPDLTFSVETEIREMSRDLAKIKAAIPRVTAGAINELAEWSQETIIAGTARKLRIARSVIEFTQKNRAKYPRFLRTPAREDSLRATVLADAAGIQVSDLSPVAVNPWNVKGRGTTRGGGVRAVGGREYKGAFKAGVRGKFRVFKRRTGAGGKPVSKTPVGLLRVGTVKAMDEQFKGIVDSGRGAQTFRERFRRLADQELLKAGLR